VLRSGKGERKGYNIAIFCDESMAKRVMQGKIGGKQGKGNHQQHTKMM
jgi:hypothetical protein